MYGRPILSSMTGHYNILSYHMVTYHIRAVPV